MAKSKTKTNVRKLFDSIDNLAGKLSKDLDMLAEEKKNPDGTEVELSSKLVDTFLKMVKEVDKIKSFSEIYDTIDENGVVTTVETKTETIEKRSVNMFEEIQNKVKNKPQDGMA